MAITPLPTPPSRDDPTNFATRADAFLAALPDFATEANALAVDVNTDASDAAQSVIDAQAAVTDAEAAAVAATAAANATKWVSGTTYTEGAVVWSPTNYLTYRRKSTGGGTTDPISDSTNWAQAAGTGDVSQSGTQTLTNKTLTAPTLTTPNITTGLTIAGSAGTAGQLLASGGSGHAPTWTTASSPLMPNPLTLSASANLTMSTVGATFTNSSRVINLDANRELIIYSANDYSDSISAFVYNSSTNTFGSVATVRATSQLLGATLVSTDNVLLVSVGTGGTSLQAVILSISTNTITVNTAATATLAGVLAPTSTAYYYGSLVTVGTSFVLSYGRATNVTAIRALTVSGTTVTIGSESTLTPASTNAGALYPISSSVVLALSSSATVLYATPFTVSGSTLTVGTGVTQTIDSFVFFPIGVFQSGQIGVLYKNSTHYGGIVSVSGTTATISSAQVWSTTGAMTNLQVFATIIGDKMLCASTNNAFGSALVNVLTNTSGSASAGTEIPGCAGNAPTGYINGYLINMAQGIPYRYSISGSNAVETIVDTYIGQSSETYDRLYSVPKSWIGTALKSPLVLRSATKTMIPLQQGSIYMNSDGTITPTKAKSFGGTGHYIASSEGDSMWFIIFRSATTVTANRVTLS